MSGINLIDATTHGTALVRGSLVSFDSATWKALVRLDESHSAIPMYVGEWISPANLDAGRRVAVLLFDAANPEDGLVIGTFGAVRWRQFDRLYASDGSPVALQTDANGYVGIPGPPAAPLHVRNITGITQPISGHKLVSWIEGGYTANTVYAQVVGHNVTGLTGAAAVGLNTYYNIKAGSAAGEKEGGIQLIYRRNDNSSAVVGGKVVIKKDAGGDLCSIGFYANDATE